jgi:replicative DNA helicase
VKNEMRVPPHSAEAEQSVLGGLLLDNSAWDRAGDLLTDSDFYRYEHRLIYAAIGALINARRPADVITVFEQLQRSGNAGECGGLEYLNALAQSVPSAANLRRYAEIVRERSMLRHLVTIGDRIASAAFDPRDRTIAALVDEAQSELGRLEQRDLRQTPTPLAATLSEVVDRLTLMHERGSVPGWPTGFAKLDGMVRIAPGDVVILAARPSVGKTALAASVARHWGERGWPTLILSQEMTRAELAIRFVADVGRIDYSRLQAAQLGDAEWGRLSDAVESLRRLPIEIDDQAALRLSDIKAKARAVKGLQLVVIDYLQLAASAGVKHETRNAEIESITRGLKALAKELGIGILLLSQLNREVEKRASKRPTLADLRDSGAIEQDADAVLMLWVAREEHEGKCLIGCSVEKNRRGRRGEVAFDFHGATQTWRESADSLRTQSSSNTITTGGFR